uniref:Uncharacterized protein n=1 Tax=Palpitomonas bilix TaxID=652834 RepID=A0A7S3D3A6_9EUKA
MDEADSKKESSEKEGGSEEEEAPTPRPYWLGSEDDQLPLLDVLQATLSRVENTLPDTPENLMAAAEEVGSLEVTVELIHELKLIEAHLIERQGMASRLLSFSSGVSLLGTLRSFISSCLSEGVNENEPFIVQVGEKVREIEREEERLKKIEEDEKRRRSGGGGGGGSGGKRPVRRNASMKMGASSSPLRTKLAMLYATSGKLLRTSTSTSALSSPSHTAAGGGMRQGGEQVERGEGSESERRAGVSRRGEDGSNSSAEVDGVGVQRGRVEVEGEREGMSLSIDASALALKKAGGESDE